MADNNIWIGACCLLIIIIAVIGFLSGGNDTSDDNLPHINTTDEDTFFYYGEDTPAGQSGYTYAIVVNGSPYYMSDSNAKKLIDNGDYSMGAVMQYDLQKYDNRYRPSAYIVGSSGINTVWDTSHEHDSTMFGFQKIKNFQFTYTSGNTVGLNKDANVVKNVYYLNGSQIG